MTNPIEQRHIDTVYDAVSMMSLMARLLAEHGDDAKAVGEASWLLTTMSERLANVVSDLEIILMDGSGSDECDSARFH